MAPFGAAPCGAAKTEAAKAISVKEKDLILISCSLKRMVCLV